jgi:hypothetical protein
VNAVPTEPPLTDITEATMQKNVGGFDRFYRFGIGFLSLALVFVSESLPLKFVFALVALIGIGTAIIGYCPINAKFRVDTTKKRKTR